MHERPAFELEDYLTRVAVEFILPPRMLNGLSGKRVLELQRGDRDAVQADRDIERLLGARREAKLTGQAQPIRGVALFELGVKLVCCFKEGNLEGAAVALEAMAQSCEGTVRIHPLAQVGKNLVARLVAVQRLELGPLLGLGPSDEFEDSVRENPAESIEVVAALRRVATCE
jgi:hypothetical protein